MHSPFALDGQDDTWRMELDLAEAMSSCTTAVAEGEDDHHHHHAQQNQHQHRRPLPASSYTTTYTATYTVSDGGSGSGSVGGKSALSLPTAPTAVARLRGGVGRGRARPWSARDGADEVVSAMIDSIFRNLLGETSSSLALETHMQTSELTLELANLSVGSSALSRASSVDAARASRFPSRVSNALSAKHFGKVRKAAQGHRLVGRRGLASARRAGNDVGARISFKTTFDMGPYEVIAQHVVERRALAAEPQLQLLRIPSPLMLKPEPDARRETHHLNQQLNQHLKQRLNQQLNQLGQFAQFGVGADQLAEFERDERVDEVDRAHPALHHLSQERIQVDADDDESSRLSPDEISDARVHELLDDL